MKVVLVLLAGYLPSYMDRAEYRGGVRRSDVFSRLPQIFVNACISMFFNIRPVVIEDVDKVKACFQYILAVHPHGVLSLDHIMTVSSYHTDLEAVAPQSRRSALGAGVLFKIPFYREILLWKGCADAGRQSADWCLKNGRSISVVPGGEREQMLAQRGSVEEIVLKERLGFVRLALRHGVPLLPCYCFGEAQLYHQSRFLFGLRSFVQRKLGVALVMPYGPLSIPFLPFRTPVQLVVGTPLEIPRIAEPSREEVERHHQRYVKEVESLFERHKEKAGYPHIKLKVI